MSHRLMTLSAAALGAAALSAAAAATGAAAAPADPVVEWNRFALDLQAMPGVQPATVHPTYELAVMHAAIADAVAGIDRSAPPALIRARGPRGASLPAAVDASAHDALAALYPSSRPAIDAEQRS